MTSSSIRGAVFLFGLLGASAAWAQTAPPPAEPPPPAPSQPGAMPDVAPSDSAPSAAPAPETPAENPEDDNPVPDAPKIPKKRVIQKRENLSHRYQFGVSGMPGKTYRVIFTYDEKDTCGDDSGEDSKRVCKSVGPLFLDLQGSFGITDHLDFITDVRLGLKVDVVSNNKQMVIAPGIRYWVDPDDTVKLYTTVQVAWDHTPQDQPMVETDDVALRNSNGVMFDVLKNFGIFLQVGETIGFRRWLRFEIDGGVGMQLRVP